MRAFRNLGGVIVEIDVDIDLNGNPILPDDTTVNDRPESMEGYYTTVVGDSWVHIPIPSTTMTLDHLKKLALDKLNNYKNWYIEQPVEFDNVLFDGDEQARTRLTQAILMHSVTSYLPPVWIAADNSQYNISDISNLIGIAGAVQTAFATRFYEMDVIRQNILNSESAEDLNAITIPVIPMLM